MGIAVAIIVIVAWLLPKNPREWVLLATLAVFSAPVVAYKHWPTATLIVGGILAALFVGAFVKLVIEKRKGHLVTDSLPAPAPAAPIESAGEDPAQIYAPKPLQLQIFQRMRRGA